MSYNFPIDNTVERKLRLIRRCLPAESAIDYGGMWEVDGYYSNQSHDKLGVKHVTMVDIEKSENWIRNPSLREGIDFREGDFSDSKFMRSIEFRYDLGIAFDVLLHQINLRETLSLMLSKVRKHFVVTTPVIPDGQMPYRNSLVLLSGVRDDRLIPFREKWTEDADYWSNFSDPTNVRWNHWLWGLSPSFLQSLMAGLGWDMIHKEIWRGWLPKDTLWRCGGFVFKRHA